MIDFLQERPVHVMANKGHHPNHTKESLMQAVRSAFALLGPRIHEIGKRFSNTYEVKRDVMLEHIALARHPDHLDSVANWCWDLGHAFHEEHGYCELGITFLELHTRCQREARFIHR